MAGGDFCLDESSELYEFLTSYGYDICEAATCKTYDEYQQLAACDYAITTFPAAKVAGDYLEKNFGQKHLYLPASFSYDKIDENMKKLQDILGLKKESLNIKKESSDVKKEGSDIKSSDIKKEGSDKPHEGLDLDAVLAERKAQCEDAFKNARAVIGDTEIAIDFTAFPMMLSLTKLLLEHGFNVKRLYTDSFPAEEKEIFLWIKENAPDIEVYPTVHAAMRVQPRKSEEKVLAIGQKAAYFTGTDYFVNVVEGGGFWGYGAVLKLVELMCEAYETSKDTKSLIQIKGMGCGNCV